MNFIIAGKSLCTHLKHTIGIFSIEKRSSLRRFTIKKALPHKCSDTLFVLGSGPSVLQFSERQWSVISKNDSIGFNFWLIHDLIPSFYTIEFSHRNKDRNEVLFHNLQKKAYSYRKTILIFKYKKILKKYLEDIPTILEKAYVANTLSIPGDNCRDFNIALKMLNKLKLIESNGIFFSRTASVDWIVVFAVKMGYKNIVLCGIDLNNTDYFYEKNGFKLQEEMIIPPNLQQGKIHKTNDPQACYGGVPIKDVLLALDKIILKPRKVNIFIASKDSALASTFPLYSWENKEAKFLT